MHLRQVGVVLLFLFMCAAVTRAAAPTDLQERIYYARDRVLPALVHIQPVIRNYDTGELEKQAVIGSGVIFHKDGYVVTNYHVAGKAVRIICTLYDKEQVPAEFVGGDPMTDLSVIKLDLSKYDKPLQPAEFGDSDSIHVGQYVLAMGSPLSLSRSVSAGVISTRDRYFDDDVRLPTGEQTGKYNLWIQTDAAINPGNSGGPLVDLDGRVVGINSRATLFANNIGFAIPVNVVKEVTAAILDHGAVERSWIGVHAQALQELADFFGADSGEGVLISSIDPGSPAEARFLKAGDIITAVDGRPVSARFVEELPAFYNRISRIPPGSEVTLSVKRDGATMPVRLRTKRLGDLQGEDFEAKGWGFTVKAITRQMQIDATLPDTLGVIVVGVKRTGPAGEGGLRAGDVIQKVNDAAVGSLEEFAARYRELSALDTERILLTVSRTGSTRF
ncbi:MAG TPA: trypsin-like peptidase domain-containing protein, partial [candidate division Zixibacteria bacterium]|nr:trypsin-like peptidase domain-containing protein [candidate division Zixibacteria bacterium]